jgi:hypothetical protein
MAMHYHSRNDFHPGNGQLSGRTKIDEARRRKTPPTATTNRHQWHPSTGRATTGQRLKQGRARAGHGPGTGRARAQQAPGNNPTTTRHSEQQPIGTGQRPTNNPTNNPTTTRHSEQQPTGTGQRPTNNPTTTRHSEQQPTGTGQRPTNNPTTTRHSEQQPHRHRATTDQHPDHDPAQPSRHPTTAQQRPEQGPSSDHRQRSGQRPATAPRRDLAKGPTSGRRGNGTVPGGSHAARCRKRPTLRIHATRQPTRSCPTIHDGVPIWLYRPQMKSKSLTPGPAGAARFRRTPPDPSKHGRPSG